jgi:hypothetical protein
MTTATEVICMFESEFINKSTIKKNLKSKLDLGNIRYQDSGYHKGKSLKVGLGIYGSGHSPMDATSQAYNRVKSVGYGIQQELENMGLEVEARQRTSNDPIIFTANPGTKKEFKGKFIVQQYSSHPPSSDLDSGYMTSWWVLSMS